jgi:hypothetical protein
MPSHEKDMTIKRLGKLFGKEYFEDGVRSGISLYEDYKWLPDLAFARASVLKRFYPDKTILEVGAAKGYLVYALRLLNVEAYGYEVSEYAIENCKEEVRDLMYMDKSKVPDVDVIIGKDVLEHIPSGLLEEELYWMYSKCKEALFTMPLGDCGRYRVAEFHYDKTHFVIEDEEWWAKLFLETGFIIKDFYHSYPGFKDNWLDHHPYGNGIFLLEK